MSRSLARPRRCARKPCRPRLPGPTDHWRCSPATSCPAGCCRTAGYPAWFPDLHSVTADLDSLDRDLLQGLSSAGRIAVVVASFGYFPDDIQTLDDDAKRRVIGLQPALPGIHDEELAAVGARPGVGHGQGARRVLSSRGVLVGELVPGASAAGPGGVAALQHV